MRMSKTERKSLDKLRRHYGLRSGAEMIRMILIEEERQVERREKRP